MLVNSSSAWLLWWGCLALTTTLVRCKTRKYFIGAVDINWDFAPLGNLVNIDPHFQEDYDKFLTQSTDPPRIGKIYKKSVLREFEDGTFSRMKKRPEWLGVLGPIIRAEIGDKIEVLFWNNASVANLTLHPHGVRYNKDSEGALYVDGTSGKDKADDGVPPGGRHTYHWDVDARFGPTEKDPPCLTWAYHSHHFAERDINTGLIGAMVLCKKGILDDVTGKRKDVDREYVLFYHIMDENRSWHIEENLNRVPNMTEAKAKDILQDEEFRESNKMHAINGYMFGNLLGIKACVKDTISWHLFALGSEMDVHNVRFQGQTMIKRNRRSNFATLFPAKFVTLRSQVHFSGNWTINCEVYDHLKSGMRATLTVDNCGKSDDFGNLSKDRLVRTYNIMAEEVYWNYGPSGLNKLTGKKLEDDELASVHFSKENGQIGGTYLKAVYRQYTDSNFTTKSPREPHLGILGPTIYCEIGDILKINFFNNATKPYSLMPNGAAVRLNASAIKYFGLEENPQDVGEYEIDQGAKQTSYWLVTKNDDKNALMDNKCMAIFYSSYGDLNDNYAGLLGFMVVCQKGALNSNGRQENVDKEYFLLLANFDENEAPYYDENMYEFFNKTPSTMKPDMDDMDDMKMDTKRGMMPGMNMDSNMANMMYSINGLMYGNLEGLTACLGDHIMWYALCIGSEMDVHVLTFDGLGITFEGSHTDSVDLFPGVTRTFTMDVDSTGTKNVDCRTTEHHLGGMQARMNVEKCPGKNSIKPPIQTGKERVYYIGAVEVVWDYSPEEIHPIYLKNLTDVEESRIFIQRDSTHIGKKYKKALFCEFTDSTFTERKPRPPQMGFLGPLIKAEVGDTVKIHFKNMASRRYNIRAHGVLQDDAEGGVEPNETGVFNWRIAERSGPGKDDLKCITWAYSSTLDLVKDINTGLVGPLVVCKKGVLMRGGTRRGDVDKEYPLMFSITDENYSWYLDENIKTYVSSPDKVDKDEYYFKLSNQKHGINGLLYGNLKGLVMDYSKTAAFYLLGFGSQVDIHTVHFHGETFLSSSGGLRRGDVTEVFPGTFMTLELTPINPGTWLLHCHLDEHMEAGMMTTYTVLPAPAAASSSQRSNTTLKIGKDK